MEYPENHTGLSGLGHHVSAVPSSLLTTAAADFSISGTAEPECPELMSIQPPPEPTVNPTPITFNDAVSKPYLFSGDPAEQTVVNPSVVTTARGGGSTKLDSLNRIAHSAGRLLNHTSLLNDNGIFGPLSSAASYGFLAVTTTTQTRVCSPQPCSSSGKEQVMRWSSPSQLGFTTDNNRDSMSPMSQGCESSNFFSISFDNNGLRGAVRSQDLGVDNRYPNNLISFFSVSPGFKRSRTDNGGSVLNYGSIDLASQITLSPEESDWHLPEGSFACKKGARSSSTTHRRSIAERERRTKISDKLRKLQEVVPNVDKKTSYAEMLDFAVEHLKGLQNQVQKLRKKLDACKCVRDRKLRDVEGGEMQRD